MTERERLIQLIDTPNKANKIRHGKALESEHPSEILADYLLDNGVIVPPCQVGDTVYAYCDEFFVVLPYFVENLRIAYLDEKRVYYTYEANCSNDNELLDEIDFDFEDIGKSVFLTEEEAEKALKEREHFE